MTDRESRAKTSIQSIDRYKTGRPPGVHSSCYKKIKAPKTARKFYEEEEDGIGGHPLVEALHALSPKLARREEGEKKGGGKSNDNKNKKSKNKSNDDNNRDSNNTSNNRSDGEMAAAIFSMEEAPLSPGYWDKAEGLYFDAAKNVHKGGKNKFQELVTGSAKKKVPSKSIEVDNNNHGYFGGGGVGGITGFLTSPRLTGIVRNVFAGAKDFCDFRQMFSPDKCNDEKKNGDRKTTQPSQPFESDEEEEENEIKKVQDPGPLVFQPSPKCAKKKQRFSSAAVEEEDDIDVVNIDATPEKLGKKDFKEVAKSRRGLLPFIEEQGMSFSNDKTGSALSREETVLHAFSKREVHNNPLQSPKGAKTSFKDVKKWNKISCSAASGGKISKKKSKESKLTSSEALAAETYCEAILKGMRHEEASMIAAQKVREMNEKTQRLKEATRERKKSRNLVPPPMPPQQGSGPLGNNNALSRPHEADVYDYRSYDHSKTNSYQVSPAVSDHGQGQELAAANVAAVQAPNNSNIETYTAHDDNNKTTNGGGGGGDGGGLWSPIWQLEKAVSQFCSTHFPNPGEEELNLPDPLGDFEALSPRRKENGGGHAPGGSRMIWWTR